MSPKQANATAFAQPKRPRRRIRRLRRWAMATIPIVIWLAAAAGAWHLHRQHQTGAALTGFADIQPVTVAHLESGTVRRVHVSLHDHVRAGQMLISVDDRAERMQLAAIEEDMERLAAQVASLDASVAADNARATADVNDLARRFAVDREAAHLGYLTQLAANAETRIRLRWAEEERDITRALHDNNQAAYREYLQVETDADALREELDKGVELLSVKKDTFDHADRRWARFMLTEDVAVDTEPATAPVRLAIEVRRRELESLLYRIECHVLRAPIDGQVTTLRAHTGDTIEVGDPLAIIAPTHSSSVVTYLPEHRVRGITIGASASIECVAPQHSKRLTFAGTIVSLSAVVEEAPLRYRQDPALPVWGRALVVALEQDAQLIPGEVVAIRLNTR